MKESSLQKRIKVPSIDIMRIDTPKWQMQIHEKVTSSAKLDTDTDRKIKKAKNDARQQRKQPSRQKRRLFLRLLRSAPACCMPF